jgi:hypothetical protein
MRRDTRAAIQLLVLIASAAAPTLRAAGDTTIAERSVTASLVKADDLSVAPWPDESFQLATNTVTIPPNASIYDLLTANGIEPDVEAFTLVYDLNPSLKRVDPLPGGLGVLLPQVVGSNQLRQKLGQGYLVMLTVDPTLRDELGKSAADLQGLSARVAQIPVERFSDASAKENTISQVRALASWFAYAQTSFLQRTGPPLRRRTLLGMHDEAQALNSLLAGMLTGQDKVTVEDQDQVSAIYRDIQSQIKKYDNIMAGEPQHGDDQYQVIVNIQGKDAELIKTLQVYYTLEGLYRKPPKEPLKSYPFDRLGSGVSAGLALQDYVIWAAKPGRPFPPSTEPHPISIQAAQGSPRYLDLSLIP